MAETFDDRVSYSENPTRFIKKRISEVSPTWDSGDNSSQTEQKLKPTLWISIVSGGIAGLIVDLTLYPLDACKTRLQSKEGFRKCGGFKNIYKGIVPVLLTSAPISALFFATYNTLVNNLRTENTDMNPLVYIVAASAAEIVCSSIRVPIEVIKQRKQVFDVKSDELVKRVYRTEGVAGFYRGFWSTLVREIPFAAIQFPLWEYMINQVIAYKSGEEPTALQIAYCGAAAGAVAAAVTTPMDVVRTRVMLAEKEKVDRYRKFLNFYMAREVYQDRGITGFFAGVLPRVLWITFGGFIYFGAYEKTKMLCERKWETYKSASLKEQSPSYPEGKIPTCDFVAETGCEKKKERLRDEPENEDEADEALKEKMEKNQNILDATLLPAVDDSSPSE